MPVYLVALFSIRFLNSVFRMLLSQQRINSLMNTLQLILAETAVASLNNGAADRMCKTIPGDRDWPSSRAWANLNQSVDGRLIATIPLASVCHTTGISYYNETACDALKAVWDYPQTQYVLSIDSLELVLADQRQNSLLAPGEIDSPWFQNESCDPFTPSSQPCSLGNYASYSINVLHAEDVVSGISFARNYNVRLVIKNTGHE